MKKKPRGRPTTYKPEYCQTILKLMTNGHTIEHVATKCGGVYKQTLYEWARDYKDFGDAMQLGKQKAKEYYMEKMQKAIFDKDAHIKENAFKWLMAVRFGLREKIETTNLNTNLNTEVDLKQLEAIKAEIRQAAKDAAEFS